MRGAEFEKGDLNSFKKRFDPRSFRNVDSLMKQVRRGMNLVGPRMVV